MQAIQPPAKLLAATEPLRAGWELNQLLWRSQLLRQAPRGDGHAVIALPGYGGGDGSMAALRFWLRHWGYDARRWDLGRNLPRTRITRLEQMSSYRDQITEQLAGKLQDIHAQTGRKVSVVGWSLGGSFANCLAQRYPQWVRRAITLGTPYGDPRGTAAWSLLKRLNRSDVPEEVQNFDEWLAAAGGDREVPTSVIFSRRDGIVSPSVARLPEGSGIEHIEVRSSHIGFALNPKVYWVIADRLQQREGEQTPFDPHRVPSAFQA